MELYIKNNLSDITYPDVLIQSSRDPESVEYYVGICANLPSTNFMKPLNLSHRRCIGVNPQEIKIRLYKN